jgi:ketose-bisphosphate aldolase
MINSLKELLNDAKINHYAVGAFNVFNLEYSKAIIEAAEELKSPVIVQISESVTTLFGIKEILSPCLIMAEKAKIPVCVHLDHAKSVELVFKCIKEGFPSVMYDGSALDFNENLSNVIKITQIAKVLNISVEAEIGKVGKEDSCNNVEFELTDIDEAVIFSQKGNMDALAISIGNIHGITNPHVSLNIDLLKKIRSKIDLPLVLHGSSGVMDNDIKEAINNGILKINVATMMKNKVAQEVYAYTIENGLDGLLDTKKLSNITIESIKSIVKDRINLFGSFDRY